METQVFQLSHLNAFLIISFFHLDDQLVCDVMVGAHLQVFALEMDKIWYPLPFTVIVNWKEKQKFSNLSLFLNMILNFEIFKDKLSFQSFRWFFGEFKKET